MSQTMLRSEKLKESNLDLRLKELNGYLTSVGSVTSSSKRRQAMQNKLPMIHDTLFRISKLLPPIDYFQQLLLVGRFCFNNQLYTIGVKEFYDKIDSERKIIDISVEVTSIYARQFELLWNSVKFECDLYRNLCVFYSILELDPHLEYNDKKKEIISILFRIQNLISSAIETHPSLLVNHIFNAGVMLTKLIEIISNCGIWKESLSLLAIQFNILLEILPSKVVSLNLVQYLLHQDYMKLLYKTIQLMCHVGEQYHFTQNDIEQWTKVLQILLKKVKAIIQGSESVVSDAHSFFSSYNNHMNEIIAILQFKYNRLKILQSLEYLEEITSSGSDLKTKSKKAKSDSSLNLEHLLISLQYSGTSEELLHSFHSTEKNLFVDRLVKFVTLQHRSFFRHAAPESIYRESIVSYIDVAIKSLKPYLSLYRHYFKLPQRNDDTPITKDMFNPEVLLQSSNPQPTKQKPTKGKEDLLEVSITEEELQNLIEIAYQQFDLLSLFALVKVCFHYELWEIFDELFELLLEVVKTRGQDETKVQIYILMMQFIRHTFKDSMTDTTSEKQVIMQLLKDFSHLVINDMRATKNDLNLPQTLEESIFYDDITDAIIIIAKWTKTYYHSEPKSIQADAYQYLFDLIETLRVKNLPLLCEIGIGLALYNENTNVKESLRILRFILQEICLAREIRIFNEANNADFTVLKDLDHQWIYCLHAEVVSHIFRCELKYGIQLKEEQANKTRLKELGELTKKSENPHLFGKLYNRDIETMKTLSAPVERPKYNMNYENKLLKVAGQNFYELAICNMLISNFRDTSKDKSLFIQKSIEYLFAAEEYEKRLVAQSQVSSDEPMVTILKPTDRKLLIQVRTKMTGSGNSESIDLLDDDPSDYVVYGKQQLLGEGLVTPSDISFVGTGGRWDPNQNIIISDLEPNQKYTFAAQEVDPYGEALSEITKMSTTVITMFPLPLILCWCFVTQTAYMANAFKDALKSGSKVLEPYLDFRPSLPLWEQNPLKELFLDKKKIEAKAGLLLMKEIIKCAEIMGDIHMRKVKKVKSGHHSPFLNPHDLQNQTSRLKICNYYLMSISLVEQVKDSATILRISEKIDNCLSPVLYNTSLRLTFVLDSLLHITAIVSQVSSQYFRKYNAQRVACSLLLSLATLATNVDRKDVLSQIATIFYKIFEKIYQGCVEDQKNPKKLSRDVECLVQAFFFNKALSQSLLDNKPSNCHIDEVFISLAGTISDPVAAFSLISTKYKGHALYPQLVIQVLKLQMEMGSTLDSISSNSLTAPVTNADGTKKGKDTTSKIEANQMVGQPSQSQEQTYLEVMCAQIEFNKLITKRQEVKKDTIKDVKKAQKGKEILQTKVEETQALEKDKKSEVNQQKKLYNNLLSYPSGLSGVLSYLMFVESHAASEADSSNPNVIISVFNHFSTSLQSAITMKQYKMIIAIGNTMKNVLASLTSMLWQSSDLISVSMFVEARNSIVKGFKLLSKSLIELLVQVQQGDSIDSNSLKSLSEYNTVSSIDIVESIEFQNISEGDALGFSLPWIDRLVDIDVRDIATQIEFSLELLLSNEECASVAYEIAHSFILSTNNYFAAQILPYMIDAKHLLKEDAEELEIQLEGVTKDIPKTQLMLNECRQAMKKFMCQVFMHFDRADITLPSVNALIKQYEITLTEIRSKHDVSLLTQALHELADLYTLHKNDVVSSKLWAESLDNSLQTVSTLDNFQRYIFDKRVDPLKKFGFWNVINAIISAANLGKYKLQHESDIHTCTKACVLVANLVLSLFSISIHHPQRFCDFASYDLKQFGVNIFADKKRCNQVSLLRSLQFATHHMIQSEQYIRSLPVCTLYEYMARFIVCDRSLTIDASLSKCKALIEVGYLNDAFQKLKQLMLGQQLPDAHLNHIGVYADNNKINFPELQKFNGYLNQSRSLESEQNQEFLHFCADLDLNWDSIQPLFGNEFTNLLFLTLSAFLRRLASSDPIQCISVTKEVTDDKSKKEPTKKGGAKGFSDSQKNIFQRLLESTEKYLNILLMEHIDTLSSDLRVKCLLEQIRVLKLKGEGKAIQRTSMAILEAFSSNVQSDSLFELYHILAQNSFELGYYQHCVELCSLGINLSESATEHLQRRYFVMWLTLSKFYLKKDDTDRAENVSRILKTLLDQDIGFEELDSLFIPCVYSELAHSYEMNSLYNLPNTWKYWLKKYEASEVVAAETYYQLAAEFLDNYLYQNGLFEEVPEDHEVKKSNLLLRNEAKDLAMRCKLKVATILMTRGDYQASLKYMESIDRLLHQFYGVSSSLRAQFKFSFGRLHRHLINTPHNAENFWGTKKLHTLTFSSEVLKNDKAELTFLPPTKRLEDSLNQAFIHSFHDHSLLRRCLMELTYLYGCKIVEDSSVHSAHTLISFMYLIATGRLTNMNHTLKNNRRKLLADSGRQLSDALPPFLSEAIEEGFNHSFSSQFKFITKNNLDDIIDKNKIIYDSKYTLDYFVQQREQLPTTSINGQAFIEGRLLHIHKYLLRSCSAYASELLLTNIPDIKSLPTIEKSLVCMQFYTIDTGLYPKQMSTSRAMSLTEKLSQKQDGVSLPLVSLFYGLTTSTHESNTLPMMGMLSFEQDRIQNLQLQLIQLRDLMVDNHMNDVPSPPPDATTSEETVVQSNSKAKSSTKGKGKEEQQELTPLQHEIYTLKETIVGNMVELLHTPSTVTKSNSAPHLEKIAALQPKMTLDLVRKLCVLFDCKGGIYVYGNAELAEWFVEILRIYH